MFLAQECDLKMGLCQLLALTLTLTLNLLKIRKTKKNNVFLKRKEKVYLGGGPVVKFSQNI